MIILPLVISITFISTNTWAGFRYQAPGCEFSVEFPDKPTIYKVFIPEIGKVVNAEHKSGKRPEDALFLNVECFSVSKDAPIFKQPEYFLTKGAQDYAESNGIVNAEYRYFEDIKGKGISMRGYKKIDGVPVIYSTMTILGSSSMISLRAGSAAEIFPPAEVIQFLKSVRRYYMAP